MGLAAGRRKRAREEEQGAAMAPQRARRSNPRRVVAPVPALPSGFNEAIQFVLAVKREFAGEPPGNNKYEEFLAILKEFKSVGIAAVVDRVKVLFAGHPDLLRGFDRFMPRGLIPSTSRDGAQTAGN